MAEGEESTIGGASTADGPSDRDAPILPWLVGIDRISEAEPPSVCRFLGRQTTEGFGPPVDGVDDANRCLALGDAAPQSARQQELVCRTAAHRNCPRYLRGVLVTAAPPAAPRRDPIAPAVIVASLILVAAIAASFGFLAVRGGLTVAIASPSPDGSQIAVVPAASITPITSGSPTPATSPVATAPAIASPSPSPSPLASSTPSPTATPPPPTETPAPATHTPAPSSDRYLLLRPCPSTPDCWIYTIRNGDNLVSIAHYFGVSLDAVYAMNPWARTTGLRAGQELRLPPPTR
ncbi:MAG TPA: LysM domain-containing protein [Candidatus Limnocylindrales bacterium]|nr:LysM domain-containing protein [Candidatus Limnocylindrales bacterium]